MTPLKWKLALSVALIATTATAFHPRLAALSPLVGFAVNMIWLWET